MSKVQTILLIGFLVLTLAVIILTWGSVGSAILTLALLLALGYLLIQKIMSNRDPDDFRWED